MSNTSDFNNISCFDEQWPWFTTKELEEDPVLKKLASENKENALSEEEFFRKIDGSPNLLYDSVDLSTITSTIKSPPLSTAMSVGAKKAHRDLKKSLSFPPSTAKSTVADELNQPETPRITEDSFISHSSLRRSQRTSTQKKTQATEERLKQRSSSAATTPKTNDDIAQFLSPSFGFMTAHNELPKQRSSLMATPKMSNDDTHFLSPGFESVMAQSALSNSLSSDMKQLLALLTDPLIPTPSKSFISKSLVTYPTVPGLDEWNHLFLSRPQMGSQFAVWNWLDKVRLVAFRFPPSAVKPEESRLNSWTQGTINSGPCDMSISMMDVFNNDVYGGGIMPSNETDDSVWNTFVDDFLNEDEPARASEETKPGMAAESKEVLSPCETSVGKTSDDISPIRIEFQKAGNHAAVDDPNDATVSAPTDSSASQKTVLADKAAVSFKQGLSPKLKNAASIMYRKTPHIKASQPTTHKTILMNPHAPGYHPSTPFDKAHYPTTPYGCDSPSTDIPDSWVQLFLDRPDPFESSARDVLAWLGEVSDILENVNVKIPSIAVSCMPTVSSMNDTPMTRKLSVMSPVFSPMMMSPSFSSPLFKSNDE